jgi:hypothetical protein
MEVARKQKAGYEVVCEAVFRPLAQLLVEVLAPLRVPPPAVVLANAACAVAAAVEIGRGHLVVAALLLQLKTLLDNADGQLARATGRVTAFGRYLDSECDLLTNAAVFAALGHATGRPWLAAVAFCVLTLVLSVNFNLERIVAGRPADAGGPGLLAGVYRVVYAPQDRLVEGFVSRRERRLGSRYGDRTTLSVLANLGLSTQLAALGTCLALGRAEAYLWLVLGCGALVVCLALRRELAGRRSGTTAAGEAL